MSNRQTEEGFYMEEGGSIVPPSTYSWNYSGNPNSIPAGNNGAVTNAVLANDSGGNPNESYYFDPSSEARILFSSVHFGPRDFSIYHKFIKHSDGDINCDIISDHTGGEGWTIERQTGSNYRLVGWADTGLFIVGPFAILDATIINLFIVKSGAVVTVSINDVFQGSVGGVGSIIPHASGVMAMGALPDGPTQHNSDMTSDGWEIWDGTGLNPEQQTAKIVEGI